MREEQSIYFADTLTSTELFHPQGYMLFKPRKWSWVASLLWRGLNVLGALHPYLATVKSYTYTKADKQEITSAMLGALSGILERRGRVSDYAFVMGTAEFSELVHADISSVGFDTYRTVTAGPYRHGAYSGEWRNVPIHVVPSITGIAAIPKVIIETVRASA